MDTLPVQVLIKIFVYSNNKKNLALVCYRFWMIRKKHFVNITFQSEFDHLKWNLEEVDFRPPELQLILTPMTSPIPTPANTKMFITKIENFCKMFSKKQATILIESPSIYPTLKMMEKYRIKMKKLMSILINHFDTDVANCQHVIKSKLVECSPFDHVNESCVAYHTFSHRCEFAAHHHGISFNTNNL